MAKYHNSHQLLKKTQKHAINQRGSSGSIPSIEITKENIESGDYISDESGEYQEGGNGERGPRNNNGPPSPLPPYAQVHQSPQHQYQVRWQCVDPNTLKTVLCYKTFPFSYFRLPVYL